MKTQLIGHLEKVRYFQAVAEAGSIQEAARKIGIAQPALSKSLKILEEAVGSLLLERTRKGTSLTRDGEELLKFSYKINDLINDFEGELGAFEAGPSGILAIGMHELYVPFLWPKVIDKVSVTAPNLELKLHTEVSSVRLLELLESRTLDVVVAIDTVVSPQTDKTLFYEDQYSFYCASTFKSTVSEKIFYLENSVVSQNMKLQYLLDKNELNLKPPYSLNSYASVLSLMLSGVGVGILPEKPASFYLQKGLLKKMRKKKIKQSPHGVFLYARQSSRENRIVKFFMEEIVHEIITQA